MTKKPVESQIKVEYRSLCGRPNMEAHHHHLVNIVELTKGPSMLFG